MPELQTMLETGTVAYWLDLEVMVQVHDWNGKVTAAEATLILLLSSKRNRCSSLLAVPDHIS